MRRKKEGAAANHERIEGDEVQSRIVRGVRFWQSIRKIGKPRQRGQEQQKQRKRKSLMTRKKKKNKRRTQQARENEQQKKMKTKETAIVEEKPMQD